VATALRILDALDAELGPLRKQITVFADHQPGCRALQADYGIGPITAAALWTELGDSRRFATSRKAVRHTGLDITVHSSDGKRTAAHLSRQGPPLLRWALFEAAQCAAPARLARSRLLSAGRRPPRRQAGHPCRWPARWSAAPITPCAPSASRPSPPPDTPGLNPRGCGARICPPTDARGLLPHKALPTVPSRTHRPGKTERPPVARDTPSIIMSPQPHRPGHAHRDKAGRPRTAPLTPSIPGGGAGPGAAHRLNA
jgi:hypothetical protein